MRRDLGAAARVLLLSTFALGVVAAFLPGRLGLAARIYALVLCGLTLVLALRALNAAYPRAAPLRPRARSTGRAQGRPSSLRRLENETALGVAGSFDLHRVLRPRLREIAAGLLEARRRVSLDDAVGPAREILGEEAWEVVRPDRPPPENRLARGLAASDLRRVVDALERI